MISRQHYANSLDFRKLQIYQMKVFNDNVSELIENQEYCVHLNSAGRTLNLIIQLGANFPNERPKIFVKPKVQHHWINSVTGEIDAAPALLNYTPHSDLGCIVQSIVREFEHYPAVLLETGICNNSSSGGGCASTGAQILKNNNQQHKLKQAKSLDSGKVNLPLANKMNETSLPNLSTLSLDELKQLDKDPEFFDDFIEEMSVVQQLNEELDAMMNQVESISRENECKGTYLVELKRRLSDDYTALKTLGEKCDQLNKKYFKKSEEYAPQHIRELLQIAASNSDTDCDRHVELFLNGKIDVQTFLNNYTHSKKLSAERKAKEERLGAQLNALERAGI